MSDAPAPVYVAFGRPFLSEFSGASAEALLRQHYECAFGLNGQPASRTWQAFVARREAPNYSPDRNDPSDPLGGR